MLLRSLRMLFRIIDFLPSRILLAGVGLCLFLLDSYPAAFTFAFSHGPEDSVPISIYLKHSSAFSLCIAPFVRILPRVANAAVLVVGCQQLFKSVDGLPSSLRTWTDTAILLIDSADGFDYMLLLFLMVEILAILSSSIVFCFLLYLIVIVFAGPNAFVKDRELS